MQDVESSGGKGHLFVCEHEREWVRACASKWECVCAHVWECECTVRECVSLSGSGCMGVNLYEYGCECMSASVQECVSVWRSVYVRECVCLQCKCLSVCALCVLSRAMGLVWRIVEGSGLSSARPRKGPAICHGSQLWNQTRVPPRNWPDENHDGCLHGFVWFLPLFSLFSSTFFGLLT